MSQPGIFLTGASGFIGGSLAAKLAGRGYRPTCFVRSTSRTAGLKKLGLELRVGDITDRASIERALDGEGIVIHLAGITSEQSSDLGLSRAVNVQGTRNMIETARERGVRRFVQLSSESTKRRVRGAYAQTKLECDDLLRTSGLPYTILRPSITYGPGSRGLFQKTLGYIEGLPIVPIIGSGRQRIKPVHVDDLTEALALCLETDRTLNKEYDLTGPDRLEFNAFIAGILRELDIKKRMIHLPFSLVYGAVKLLSVFVRNPPVTTDNLLGLKQEVDMSPEDARRDFGYQPLPFPEGLRRTFYGPASAVMAGKKNVAVVGLGKMGMIHASLLNQIPEARLVGLADVNPNLKGQMRSLGLGAAFFTSVDRLLEKAKLDAVFICTPPHLNAPLAARFLDRGISVFVEKPLANDLAQAESMLSMARAKKVKTACGYMLAYHPVFRKVKEIIDSGEFGRVEDFESTCWISQVFAKKTAASTWHYDPRKTGGGVLMTMASHLVFLLWWYFGECRVAGTSVKSLYTAMDDEALAELEFRSGVRGRLNASWSVRGFPELTIGLRLNFEKAVVTADQKLIRVEGKGSRPGQEFHISRMPDEALFELGGKGYYAQDRDFILSHADGHEPPTGWASAFAAQKIIDDIYRWSDRP